MLKIGNIEFENQLIMAPMAGITNLPFRLLVKKSGAALVTTEMVNAMGLTLGSKKTLAYLKSDPAEKPLAVQIFGYDPAVMAAACEIVIDAGADLVDINMGCPARKVVKTGAGGALLKNTHLIKEIVSAVRQVCKVPLTVKIRPGWSPAEDISINIARIIEDCGADALTIHPRYVSQGFSGSADWSIIAKIKDKLAIPCIGNGDVHSPELALEIQKKTACDGVMIGRGAVGNPWLFKQILDLEKGQPIFTPDSDERKATIMEHFRLLSLSMGEIHAARMMRGLLLKYTKGLPGSNKIRKTLSSIKDFDSMLVTLNNYLN